MNRKILAVLAIVVIALAAAAAGAATSWAPITTPVPVYGRGAQGTFTAADGTDATLATTTTATLGLELKGLGGITVMAQTTGGGNMTAGGKFLAYLWNPATSQWCRVADGSLDLTVAAAARQAWSDIIVPVDLSRLAWEPSGVGTATSLYVYGSSRVLSPR